MKMYTVVVRNKRGAWVVKESFRDEMTAKIMATQTYKDEVTKVIMETRSKHNK